MGLTGILYSIALFALAGLAEIGGGYLVWLWLREHQPIWVGLIGAGVLILYGIIPALQPHGLDFGKVYAAYGGVFIVMSLLWAWQFDGIKPDNPSLIGALIALFGAVIIIYWPRGV